MTLIIIFIIIIKQTANLDGNQFSKFFYSLLFVSRFKIEGYLKWKWSLVLQLNVTILQKNCMLRLNNEIVRCTGKNPSKSVGAFLQGVNFIVHG